MSELMSEPWSQFEPPSLNRDEDQTPESQPSQASEVKRTKGPKALARYRQKQLAANSEKIIPMFFAKLSEKLNDGDKDAMQLAAKIYKLVEGGGIRINNNLTNNTAVLGGQATPAMNRTFNQIILAEEKRDRELREAQEQKRLSSASFETVEARAVGE